MNKLTRITKNKGLFKIIALILCALVICGTLAACGSGGSTSKGAKMVGYWEATEVTADGETLTEDDIKTLKEMDLLCILYLSEDGKATLDLFGEIEETTWDIENATLTVDTINATLELKDDTLTFSDENNKVVFKKGDDSLAEKIESDRKSMAEADEGVSEGGENEVTSVEIDPQVTIADDEFVTVIATARVVDENGMAGIMFSITNNTDQTIGMHMEDDSTINGGTYENYFYACPNPGETVNEICAYDGLTSVDELVDIHSQLRVYEDEHFEELGIYDVEIP